MAKNNTERFEEIDQRILIYLETLLDKKGMGDLPPEILADMLMDLYMRFENFLFLSLMQNMEPENYKKFDEFIASNPTPGKSQKFLKENVENISKVVESAMIEFEKIYLE